MTEQEPTAPVPGPSAGAQASRGPDEAGQPFADLERRPVAEHVAVFEAEHDRLQQELSSIDQL